MSKVINALDEQFKNECEIINLKYEYPGYMGKEEWAIVTNLSEAELNCKYVDLINNYKPFVILSASFGQVRADYMRNEKKHAMRATRSVEPFDYDDELCAAFHPELIVNNLEDTIIKDESIQKVRLILLSLDEKQKGRLIKFFFDGKSTHQIALEEGTTHQAISKSIGNTLKKIKKLYF